MNFTKESNGAFFSESFWLPQNVTWEDFNRFEDKDGLRMPKIQDVFVAWKLVPFVLLSKFVVEKFVAPKLGKWAGIKDELREKPKHVEILEKAHRANPWGRWSNQAISALTKQLDWTDEQIHEWFKARRKYATETTLEKFCESVWRAMFFICIMVYGIYCHWSKEWVWDLKRCYENFPQPVTEDLYWYFIISLANYSAWNISQFWDVQRKYYRILLFHHLLAVALLVGQWVAGVHRMGLLICTVHDVGDLLLEAIKCLKYLNLLRAKAWWLWIFSFVNGGLWIATRNIILPFYLIPGIYRHAPFGMLQSFPYSCFRGGACNISSFAFNSNHVLVIMLSCLGLLHVYWTCLIFRISYLALIVGKLEDDTREVSDDESDGPKMKLKSTKKE
ncbi:unnamed protein product [Bemisia tabaci]|uniref:TLC domain-containing protein n=1 Tax=Bemisia tabaci TaxID=7038 RepID=A0A9P0A576_BEMTA|nr:unnamed protein product [Bemisia tabaci]